LGWLFGRLVGSVCWLHAWLSRGSHSSWLFGLLFGWIAVSLEKGLEKMQAEAQKRQLNKKHLIHERRLSASMIQIDSASVACTKHRTSHQQVVHIKSIARRTPSRHTHHTRKLNTAMLCNISLLRQELNQPCEQTLCVLVCCCCVV